MISSMTAFARSQRNVENGLLICECRSVNHRYLEFSIYMPEGLRPFEATIKERIREQLKRGKVECWVRFQLDHKSTPEHYGLNVHLVRNLAALSLQIDEIVPNVTSSSSFEFLKFPGVLEKNEVELAGLDQDIFALLDETLTALVLGREREGAELKNYLLQRIETMQAEFVHVNARLPSVIEDQKSKLMNRFKDAEVELDVNRLTQEMVMFAQKIDITEEIERAQTHMNEIKRVLSAGGVAGRQLDFLLQELNREVNTMGSKSVDSVITHAAVTLKVLIEQMKEQVQNIE